MSKVYEPVVQFISLLRDSDVKVSTSEERDCLNALLFTTISDQLHFFLTLRSTLIKNHSDYKVFLRLFEEFFLFRQREPIPNKVESKKQMGIKPKKGLHALTKIPRPDGKRGCKGGAQDKVNSRAEDLDLEPEERQKLTDLLNNSHLKGDISDALTAKLFTCSKDELKKLAFQMVRSHNSRSQSTGGGNRSNTSDREMSKKIHSSKDCIGDSIKGTPEDIDWTRINLNISKLLFKSIPILKDGARMRAITQRVMFHLEYFKNLLLLAIELKATHIETSPLPFNNEEDELESMKQPFRSLSLHHSKDLQRLIERLAYKIATKASLRNKSITRGKVNIKQTIRKSLKYAGHPMVLKFKKRRVTKPEIILLCDISGSVRYAVQFFLLFLSHFAIAFSKVRCFVFVSLIDRLPIGRSSLDLNAINYSLNEAHVDHYGYSDFGAAFSQCDALYGRDLTHKTTMIILGDARNNKKASCAETHGLVAINPNCKKMLYKILEQQFTS